MYELVKCCKGEIVYVCNYLGFIDVIRIVLKLCVK